MTERVKHQSTLTNGSDSRQMLPRSAGIRARVIRSGHKSRRQWERRDMAATIDYALTDDRAQEILAHTAYESW